MNVQKIQALHILNIQRYIWFDFWHYNSNKSKTVFLSYFRFCCVYPKLDIIIQHILNYQWILCTLLVTKNIKESMNTKASNLQNFLKGSWILFSTLYFFWSLKQITILFWSLKQIEQFWVWIDQGCISLGTAIFVRRIVLRVGSVFLFREGSFFWKMRNVNGLVLSVWFGMDWFYVMFY